MTARSNLVSIITPAYRAADFIADTIKSVQEQSHSEWEMLIAEDCGPDDTREIVRKFSATDPRIMLIEPERNGGPAAARNHALARARGRWLAFLDSDDLWLPGKLEEQLAFHQSRPDAVLSYTGFRRISADGSRVGSAISVPPEMTYRKLLGNTAIATSTVLIDRRLSGEFRMQDTYYDDFACWLDLLRNDGRAVGLDKDLMRYRVLEASVSRDKSNSAKQVWLAYRDVQGLGLIPSAWAFARYAFNAWKKYRNF